MKSSASLASMTYDPDAQPVERTRMAMPAARSNQSLAMDSLRRIRATTTPPAQVVNNETWWPSLSAWTLRGPVKASTSPTSRVDDVETTPLIPPTNHSAPSPLPSASSSRIKHKPSTSIIPSSSKVQNPCIRTIASSPNFNPSQPADPRSGQSTPRRRLPFEPSETDSINTVIDPELAAAELRSALTKQVVCGVCNVKGVNFPECRKCGLTFCSRICRVDEKKAGDGKR